MRHTWVRCAICVLGTGLWAFGERASGAEPVAGATGTTMQAMAQEAQENVGALNRKLDQLVNELRSTTAKGSSSELRDLQLKWMRLMKAECTWESRFAQGGSVAPLIYANCMEKQLAARIDQLKPLLCEGGGMTGSCPASERY